MGFLYLMGCFLWRRRGKVERIDDALGYLTFSAVLLGTIGGLGSLFAFYVTPMIRCYDRLSIFIAFFALAGLFLLIQRSLGRFVNGRRTAAAYGGGLLFLLVLGAFDQTSAQFVPSYEPTRKQVASDADFGRRIEAALPAGSMVYEMPYVPFPENGPVQNLADYELLRPWFHTRTLRFSYGAMKGARRQPLAGRPGVAAVAGRPGAAGLRGLQRRLSGSRRLRRQRRRDGGGLSRLLDVQPLVSLSGRQTYFDMTPYVRQVRGRFSDADWEAKKESVLHPIDMVGRTASRSTSHGPPARRTPAGSALTTSCMSETT